MQWHSHTWQILVPAPMYIYVYTLGWVYTFGLRLYAHIIYYYFLSAGLLVSTNSQAVFVIYTIHKNDKPFFQPGSSNVQMPNFQNTVIYKIVPLNPELNHCYVGSTTAFTTRRYGHRYVCNTAKAKHHYLKVYRIIRDNGGWDKWQMVIIEANPCKNRTEGLIRERYYIELLNSDLNHIRRPITKKGEYTELDRAAHLASHKEYNARPEVKLHRAAYSAEYNRVSGYYDKHICGCGSSTSPKNRNKHELTIKHQKWLIDGIVLCATDYHKTLVLQQDPKEKFECVCSGRYTFQTRFTHKATKMHKTYLASLESTPSISDH